ncbi:hypothetical protein I79_007606 [Cricetulus griseus]|uniref:Uncharacterized protein n=1 Tax=Cricetulus griseus TaxID=10029 RepID=G3HAZ4_CRIGR|nr:hypothetical protein I79_007606 [Cricetulus griseus]
MDPFPGVDSVFGEEKWGGATSIPVRKIEEFATSSLKTGNAGLCQPPQATLVCPHGDEKSLQDEQTTGRAGVHGLRFRRELRSSRELQCCGV